MFIKIDFYDDQWVNYYNLELHFNQGTETGKCYTSVIQAPDARPFHTFPIGYYLRILEQKLFCNTLGSLNKL